MAFKNIYRTIVGGYCSYGNKSSIQFEDFYVCWINELSMGGIFTTWMYNTKGWDEILHAIMLTKIQSKYEPLILFVTHLDHRMTIVAGRLDIWWCFALIFVLEVNVISKFYSKDKNGYIPLEMKCKCWKCGYDQRLLSLLIMMLRSLLKLFASWWN